MMLELHDSEVGKTLAAKVDPVDYDYQAEQWVQETHDRTTIVKWILYDGVGIRCVWERPQGSLEMPNITQRSTRFSGTWQQGPEEVAIE